MGMPSDTLNRSRKYQTPAGMPPSAPDKDADEGRSVDSIEVNSVVTKNRPKNSTNLTITDLKMNPRTVFKALRTIPNM